MIRPIFHGYASKKIDKEISKTQIATCASDSYFGLVDLEKELYIVN